jgi:hypothetical protein
MKMYQIQIKINEGFNKIDEAIIMQDIFDDLDKSPITYTVNEIKMQKELEV